MAELVYKVEDRSILLPYFRRYMVDPALPFIPAKIHPNSITHAGHLVNLFGLLLLLALRPVSGWPFFVTALCVNFYNWADNADGAHARRTNQCSPFGEFLDHGLDQFNTVYFALLSAYAIGAPALAWVAMAILIPGAAVVTYWEQSNTGVFRVGLLNQVESVVVITITLAISGITGQSVWGKEIAYGLHVRDVMVLWPCSTILFGMARNLVRVMAQCGARATGPILVYLAFAAAIFGSVVVGAFDAPWAVALACALNIHLGMRMLARRLKKEPPQVEPFVLGGAVAVSGVVAWKLLGRPIEPSVVPALVLLACAALGLQVILDARTGVTLLGGRADQTA